MPHLQPSSIQPSQRERKKAEKQRVNYGDCLSQQIVEAIKLYHLEIPSSTVSVNASPTESPGSLCWRMAVKRNREKEKETEEETGDKIFLDKPTKQSREESTMKRTES